jgi:hypothetical protein
VTLIGPLFGEEKKLRGSQFTIVSSHLLISLLGSRSYPQQAVHMQQESLLFRIMKDQVLPSGTKQCAKLCPCHLNIEIELYEKY